MATKETLPGVMLRFRTFRNTDPPLVVDLWRSRAPAGGLASFMSVDVLEEYVFSKLYFDPASFFLAFDNEDRPLGFAHAALGPNEDFSHESTAQGAVAIVVVRPQTEEEAIARALIGQCEQYLQKRGVDRIYGGSVRPVNAFYLGLYGHADLPGVISTDSVSAEAFQETGYATIDHTATFRVESHDFVAPMDRRLLELRRTLDTDVRYEPKFRNWWEACTLVNFDLVRFVAHRQGDPRPLALATFRRMDTQESEEDYGQRLAGLLDVRVAPSVRRKGYATHLLTTAFHHLFDKGVSAIEAQAFAKEANLVGLFQRLGMRQFESGTVYRKGDGEAD